VTDHSCQARSVSEFANVTRPDGPAITATACHSTIGSSLAAPEPSTALLKAVATKLRGIRIG
jgi:hypothetical protein